MRTLLLTALGATLAAAALPTLADTTDVRWATTVVVAKQGDHCADDPNCMNRYHPAIPAVASANPGDVIVIHTRDALDSDLTLDSVAHDMWRLSISTSSIP